MAWYFYWQQTPESAWTIADARDRQKIIEDNQPPFVTALDLNAEITDEMPREELDDIHYRGDLYFDFDSEDIEEATTQFNKFLSKLTEIEIDLRQVELYASGGKGYHVVVPARIYIEKPHSAGYKFLPQIFKEIAQELYVDCLDMRVYSARKGRMFRTVNVLRPNGKYKVPLSVQEARTMTPDLYEQLTSAPRQAFQINEPVFNPTLARYFNDARRKVSDAIKKRRNSKADEKLVAQFNGQLPDSVKKIASGEHVKEGVGFQNLATQIAITFNALGISEEDMLKECEGLIANHQSDGYRYNTPAKRRKELSRMYHYMKDNPCYEFSAGAIKSVLAPGTPTPDLNPPVDDPHGALEEDEELGLDEEGVYKGVRFNRNGIFVRRWDKDSKEYFVVKVSELGLDDVSILQDLETRERVGYEYSAYLYGQFKAKRRVGMSSINSANALQQAIGNPESAGIQLTDAQAKALMDVMRRKAEVKGKVVTTVPREGVDYIPLPNTETETGQNEIIYAGPHALGVLTSKSPEGSYRLQTVNGQDGELKSDLISAPKLLGSTEEVRFFDTFFNLHSTEVSARVIGYYLACFLAQIIRHEFRQFPVLQVFGQAGAGKTSYNILASNLHYYHKQPVTWAANAVTPFALTSLLQSSGSIPILFDEFKTQELGIRRTHEFLMIIRNNYTGNSGGKGRVNRDNSVSSLSISQSASVAPLVFLAESLETQTAIMDRAVSVLMPERKEGSSDEFHECVQNRKILGQLGHLLVRKALGMDVESMSKQLKGFEKQVEANAPKNTGARPIFNNAVILTGLEFGRQTMETVYGDHFNETFERFKDEIIGNIEISLPENKSEGTKVLDTLAYMTALEDSNPLQLVLNVDYMPSFDEVTGDPCVDIHLRNAWDKYARYRRAQGEQPLYPSEGAFVTALMRHRAVMDDICAGSELKGGRPTVRVARYSLRMLYDEEHVEEFKNLEKEVINK